jgi:hypothetical protein
MKHIEIPFVPQPVIAWVHKHASKNYWKVTGLCDWDDLIAEGYLAISYCLNKYGNDLTAPHFMRLVQLTYNCAIIDIAKKRTKSQAVTASNAAPEVLDSTSDFDRVVAEAPTLVKKTLEYMINDISGSLLEAYKVNNGERETSNARMARLMNLDQSITEKERLMDSIRSYLHER